MVGILRIKDAEGNWHSIEALKGERGIDGLPGPVGPQGPKGADGTMKFEDLTEEQRESLRGPIGETGPQGIQGIQGEPGPAGKDGENGKDYVLTEEDKAEIAGMVEVSGGGEVSVDNKTIIKDANGAIKTSAYIRAGTGQYSSVIGVGVGADGSATNQGSTSICGGSASGNSSVAIGTRSEAGSTHSFAMGYYASAKGQKQTVIGSHNIADTTSSFILGSGTGSSAKRNAMTVDADNQVHFPGTVVVGENKEEIATKAYVEELLANLPTGGDIPSGEEVKW